MDENIFNRHSLSHRHFLRQMPCSSSSAFGGDNHSPAISWLWQWSRWSWQRCHFGTELFQWPLLKVCAEWEIRLTREFNEIRITSEEEYKSKLILDSIRRQFSKTVFKLVQSLLENRLLTLVIKDFQH